MYPSFVTHFPEDGHMSDCNLWDVYYVSNIFSYTYVNLPVLATISNCSMHSNGLFKIDNQSFRPVQFMFMDQEHVTEKKFAIQPG
jgi:hypothetical protein